MLKDIKKGEIKRDYLEELIEQVHNTINSESLTPHEKGKLLIEIKNDIEQQIFTVDKFIVDGEDSRFAKQFGAKSNSGKTDLLCDILGLTQEYKTLLGLKKKIEFFLFSLQIAAGKTFEDNIEKSKITSYSVNQLSVLVRVMFELNIVPDISNKLELSTPLHMIFGRSKQTIREALGTQLKDATNKDLKKVIADLETMVMKLKEHL